MQSTLFDEPPESPHSSSCGKTSPEFTQAPIMRSAVSWAELSAQMPHSFQAAGKSGPTRVWLMDPHEERRGVLSTLNFSAWPNGARVSSLSQVLERFAAPRYYLSAAACAGILRRAVKRGKALPELLAAALKAAASAPRTSTTPGAFIPVAFKASHYTREKDGAPNVTAPPLSADADKGDQDTLICSPEVAGTLSGGARRDAGYSLDDIPVVAFGDNSSEPLDVAAALQGRCGGKHDFESETFIAFDTTSITQPNNRSNPQPGEPVHTLAANQHPPAIAFSCKGYAQDAQDDQAPTLRSMNEVDGRPNGGGQLAVAFAMRGRDGENMPEVCDDGDLVSALRAESGGSTRDLVAFADVADPLVCKEGATYTQEGAGNFRVRNVVTDLVQWAVRRLTPTECERLQGAPDGHTLVKVRRVTKNNAIIAAVHDAGGGPIVLGKPGAERPYQLIDGEVWALMADGPRYKLLGNSKAVPVVRWIGERIILARAA